LKNFIQKEYNIFLTALIFFTRIPVRLKEYREEWLNSSTKYISVVGWIVGGLGGGVFLLAHWLLPLSLAVIISIIFTIWLTGAFHEDGFADVCDGLGGGYSKEQILTIMKDSRTGAYGVIGMILILLTKYLALRAISPGMIPFILIGGHTLSRMMIPVLIRFAHYTRDADTSKVKPVGKKISAGELIFAIFTGLVVFLLLPSWLFVIILPVLILVTLLFRRMLVRQIGGYTGDTLGALQQIGEIVFYLCYLAIVKHYSELICLFT